MTRLLTTLSEPPAPPVPVAPAVARNGDWVILARWPFDYTSAAPPDLFRVPVKSAGNVRLNAGGAAFYRTGSKCGRTVAGASRATLVEPTPERLAALAECERRRAASVRARDNDHDERRLNRRIAADWLAAQTDPDEIERLLFGHTLDDVFQVLRQARIA